MTEPTTAASFAPLPDKGRPGEENAALAEIDAGGRWRAARRESCDDSDDSAATVWVDVTNPDGATFPAVLGKFHKAGVVTFFVLPEDCPPGEEPYERCEWTKPRPTFFGGDPTTRVYRVARRG